jgi:hypothetical protein
MPKDHQPEPRRRGDRIIIFFAAMHESAFGPKRTWSNAPHMSAFGGKADINSGTTPALGSYEGGGYGRRQDEGR